MATNYSGDLTTSGSISDSNGASLTLSGTLGITLSTTLNANGTGTATETVNGTLSGSYYYPGLGVTNISVPLHFTTPSFPIELGNLSVNEQLPVSLFGIDLDLTVDGTVAANQKTITENVTESLSGSYMGISVSGTISSSGVLTAPPPPPAPSALSFAVAVDDGASGDTFTVGGNGVVGDTVTLFDGATTIGTTEVGAGGTWSITTASPLGIGAHTLTAKEAGATDGQSAASKAEQLTITSATPNGVTFTGTAGTDNFTGGAGNDIFRFSAASLAATDTVVGGAGSDELLMTTAGTINAGGVSGVETYKLANGGANTLVLSNANFAGVTGNKITVKGGSGGNTIDASGLTGSLKAVLDGGAGADVLIAGRHETMTGGAGADTFEFTTPGTLTAPDTNVITDFAHSTDKIAFSDAGFSLGLAGASSTPTALPSTLFVSNATGAFTSADQRFAYDTATGQLFYDAHGNHAGSSVHLVATLNGEPTLTASDLFLVT